MKIRSNLSRPITLAIAVCVVSSGPLHSGFPEPPFVTPPGGLIDPVFVPTPKPAPALNGAASAAATRLIVVELDAARNFCRRMPSEEYAIDCLGDALQSVANGIPAGGDYGEAKTVLADAARKLRTLAKENASTVLPTGTMRSKSDPNIRSSSPLTPVARDKLAESNAQAIAILEEAETLLLRSAANSAARKVHYQRISTALGSNKVLLRST